MSFISGDNKDHLGVMINYGPAAQTEQYPQQVLHFAANRETQLQRFLQCDGLLLYEAGSGGGTKATYGYGTISPNQN